MSRRSAAGAKADFPDEIRLHAAKRRIPRPLLWGATLDLKRRFGEHNDRLSPHTKKFAPWRPVGYVAFSDHAKADAFEAYLKTASGRAFAKKHF
ncbi:MAG: GIY-YIG nuclease family protein [Bauldia sp.]